MAVGEESLTTMMMKMKMIAWWCCSSNSSCSNNSCVNASSMMLAPMANTEHSLKKPKSLCNKMTMIVTSPIRMHPLLVVVLRSSANSAHRRKLQPVPPLKAKNSSQRRSVVSTYPSLHLQLQVLAQAGSLRTTSSLWRKPFRYCVNQRIPSESQLISWPMILIQWAKSMSTGAVSHNLACPNLMSNSESQRKWFNPCRINWQTLKRRSRSKWLRLTQSNHRLCTTTSASKTYCTRSFKPDEKYLNEKRESSNWYALAFCWNRLYDF